VKGTRSITIGGKEIPLVFDWGCVEDFCEDEGVTFGEFESAIQSPKKMRSLIYHMARSGGSKIKKDDLRKMRVSDMSIVSELISESMTPGNERAGEK
jgi:hypothetical protein